MKKCYSFLLTHHVKEAGCFFQAVAGRPASLEGRAKAFSLSWVLSYPPLPGELRWQRRGSCAVADIQFPEDYISVPSLWDNRSLSRACLTSDFWPRVGVN